VISLENVTDKMGYGGFGIINSYLAVQSLCFYTKNMADLCQHWLDSNSQSLESSGISPQSPISSLLSMLYVFAKQTDITDEDYGHENQHHTKHSILKNIVLQLLDTSSQSYFNILDQWLGFRYMGAEGREFDPFKEVLVLSNLPTGTSSLAEKEYCAAVSSDGNCSACTFSVNQVYVSSVAAVFRSKRTCV
jgi:hypothetical protein